MTRTTNYWRVPPLLAFFNHIVDSRRKIFVTATETHTPWWHGRLYTLYGGLHKKRFAFGDTRAPGFNITIWAHH